MQTLDNKNSYGWVSILTHWITASLIFTLWFLGNTIQSDSVEQSSQLAYWHVSIAATAYLFFIFRIYWRLKSGHPKLVGQGPIIHKLGKIAHYAMLIMLILLLLSGPFILWGAGVQISIFNWIQLPSPTGYVNGLSSLSHSVHFYASTAMIIIATLHMSAAFKHMMFHEDETFLRIFWPRK